jgi:hypothetical protein
MNVKEQIKAYIATQTEPKRNEMQALHQRILQVMPKCKLWFLDGRDDKGKTVANPNIGYDLYTIEYANARSDGRGGRETKRAFYQIGLSANTTGISVYIMGIKDKKYLAQTYGKKIGKASVTGYCIKFKMLKDINMEILEAAILYGVNTTNEKSQLCP